MEWEDERYIRYYIRDTVTFLTWPWEAQALIGPLLRKLDRRGRLMLGGYDPVDAVWALYSKWPREVVAVGIEAMLKCKTLVVVDDMLIAPNFVKAQEARRSAAERKRAQRERERIAREEAGEEGKVVTLRDHDPHFRDTRHETSPLAEPSLAEPSLAKPRGVRGDPEDVAVAPPPRAKRVAARQVSKFRSKSRAREIFDLYEQQRTARLGGNVTKFTDDHYRAMQQTVRYIQQERGCDQRAAWDWLDVFGKAAIEEAASPDHSPEWAEKLRRWRTGPQAWAKKRYQAVMAGVDGGKGKINGNSARVRRDESTGEFFIIKNGVRYECDENGQVIVHG